MTLLRKDACNKMAFSPAYNTYWNGYEGSALDMFCDTQWIHRLDEDIRKCLVNVPILVSEGNKVGTIHTLYRKAFALSEIEMFNTTAQSFAGEGTPFTWLSGTQANRIANLDGTSTAVNVWLRSPYASYEYGAAYVGTVGSVYRNDVYLASCGARPAFNLLSTITVSSATDGDGCYTIEDVPTAGGGLYIKQGGAWVQAL